MAKILKAIVNDSGEVLFNNYKVNEGEILSEGKQASSGALLIDDELALYLTSNASDIKTTLTKVSEALGLIANTLKAIGNGMAGPGTAPPEPLLTNNVELLKTLKDELSELSGALK